MKRRSYKKRKTRKLSKRRRQRGGTVSGTVKYQYADHPLEGGQSTSMILGHQSLVLSGSKPWAIVQYDNREIPDDYKKLVEINKEYCKKYGYEYIFKSDTYELPHWWIKVKLCMDLLNSDKYAGIMWLDTDAAIFDCSKTLDDFTKDPKIDFFVSKDPDESRPVNSGVWIVKNTAIGKNIMNDWFNQYKKDNWVKENDKWSVNPNLPDDEKGWGRINYEQGSLYDRIILNPTYKDNIIILPVKVLSHWKPTQNDGSFVGHFFRVLIPPTDLDDNPHTTEHYLEVFFKTRIVC